ncbi:MAG TPA: DoxX family protein [Caldithrix abyssi]|uniref:DoxX family protein n=1 Tax=Caldithrix abyssi TaxID=187145 RepID=A0A7V5RNN1_CALAY|nr:DoxX family protein [Caldithrix abyssi]
MNILTGALARYLFALPFGIFGLFHFMNGNAMTGMVPLPGGIFWVYLTGLALIAACVSILIDKQAKLATLLLGIMLLVFALLVHLPGVLNAETMQASMPNLLKDTALAGAALLYSGGAKS